MSTKQSRKRSWSNSLLIGALLGVIVPLAGAVLGALVDVVL